jgi:hypothetical protein
MADCMDSDMFQGGQKGFVLPPAVLEKWRRSMELDIMGDKEVNESLYLLKTLLKNTKNAGKLSKDFVAHAREQEGEQDLNGDFRYLVNLHELAEKAQKERDDL